MPTEYGFVYILGNDSMPGIYKIGFTLGHPRARMEQLSAATSCPTPFRMLAFFGTPSPRDVESYFHSILSKYRINPGREFFKVSPSVLMRLIKESSDIYGDAVNVQQLEIEVGQEEYGIYLENKASIVEYFHSQCADPIDWNYFKVRLS